MIRFDRYSDATWHRAVTILEAVRVKQAIPYGYRLHVSHGGSSYTATLFRSADMEIVARETRPRIVAACEAALVNRGDIVVTMDADGYVKSIEERDA